MSTPLLPLNNPSDLIDALPLLCSPASQVIVLGARSSRYDRAVTLAPRDLARLPDMLDDPSITDAYQLAVFGIDLSPTHQRALTSAADRLGQAASRAGMCLEGAWHVDGDTWWSALTTPPCLYTHGSVLADRQARVMRLLHRYRPRRFRPDPRWSPDQHEVAVTWRALAAAASARPGRAPERPSAGSTLTRFGRTAAAGITQVTALAEHREPLPAAVRALVPVTTLMLQNAKYRQFADDLARTRGRRVTGLAADAWRDVAQHCPMDGRAAVLSVAARCAFNAGNTQQSHDLARAATMLDPSLADAHVVAQRAARVLAARQLLADAETRSDGRSWLAAA